MTGRALYDKFTDAVAAKDDGSYWRKSALPGAENGHPIAWPQLSHGDRKVWNDLARRVTPKRKAVARAPR